MALINYITQIQFEFGAISLLKQQRERVGVRRPLHRHRSRGRR